MSLINTITFKQLRALSAVVKTGSISSSADLLGLTPPAVHTQLKVLEENFGCPLVNRARNGNFEATVAGAALLDAFETSRSALGKAVDLIEAMKKGMAGRVVLGVVSTGKYFAPSIVARLRRNYPDINVVLQVGNRDRIISDLDTGRIDLAIMGRPPRQPEVTAYSIGDHPHVLIAEPGHPLARGQQAEVQDILSQHFIMREPGSGTRILAMRFLDRIGDGQPFTYTEMESNESIKQAVIAGLGIALISAHTVIEELKSKRLSLLRADSLPIIRHWFVLHRSDITPNPALSRVLDYIRANGEALLAEDEIAGLLSG
ncbi:LysR family transcriptional regulator [Roseibium aggregatum]|uniref:HTH-type transcriptional regulator CbbR n=1 Tax=Roseibium aggregatum TaxID=187304 RepID=A0A939EHT7_9HYPH|nr:LysR family transcriptional regulator [Roseibium aggregatum]MBN9672966.1 LysR family transcriptional regulator [Roseibium aggregatum]